MPHFSLREILGAAALALTLTCPAASQAAFPEKPIVLVVPFAPGGGNDLLAREIAPDLSNYLKQPIVVENKPGAGGNLGTQHVANSASDGYTILIASNQIVINPSLYSDVGFDAIKDFDPVGLIADVQFVLVANPKVSASTLGELTAGGKKVNLHYGTPGNGTPQHLAAELFNNMAGVSLEHVPYRGTGPMITDLLGGQIDLAFATLPSIEAYVKAGKVKAFAVTGSKRSTLLPDVPTIAESGIPEYSVSTWYGLLVPHNTPAEARLKIEAALAKSLSSGERQKALIQKGFEPHYVPGGETAKIMRDDFSMWEKVIKDSNLKIN